jgi:hypothetical protein
MRTSVHNGKRLKASAKRAHIATEANAGMSIYTLKDGQRHYVTHLPTRKLPEGTFLVHNHVVPVKPLSLNGFRAWVQKGKDDPPLIECRCDFGGNANADKNTHYRVRR